MATALLVSSRVPEALALGAAWADAGDTVQVVLLDRAAAAARSAHPDAPSVSATLGRGTAVAVHDGAVRRRGITPEEIVDGVKVLDIEEITDLVSEGADKVVWL